MSGVRVIYEADGLADAESGGVRGGAVLIEHREGGGAWVLARGTATELLAHEGAAGAVRRRLEGFVVVPALVNAHSHLDLSHAGYMAYEADQGFPSWIKGVLGVRRSVTREIQESTRLGIEMSLAGGVVAVGDICGVMSEAPLRVLRESPLGGVGFIELFGIGMHEQKGKAFVAGFEGGEAGGGFVKGMSPHAPYSVSGSVYGEIVRRGNGIPIATHVAESIEEREFVREGTGAFLEVLAMIGAYAPPHPPAHPKNVSFGWDRTPIEHVLLGLRGSSAPTMLVHVNDCTDRDMEMLVGWCGEEGVGARGVTYCPRAHEYFRYEESLGGHRYREMLDAGIPVALGTDSVINLDLSGVGQRITPLDDARLLYERDGMDARVLLGMITTTPARLLGLPTELFTFSEGKLAGIAAVDVRGTDASLDPIDRVFASRGGIGLMRGA